MPAHARTPGRGLPDPRPHLLQRDSELAPVMDGAYDALVSADVHGRITLFNAAACAMFGVPAQDALGSTLDRFLPGLARQEHPWPLPSAAPAEGCLRPGDGIHELSARRSNGEEFPIEATIWHSRTGGGMVMTALLRDLAARRATERALAAQQVAEQARQIQAALMSRASHELRTPLNAILGFAQLLDTVLPAASAERGMVQHILGAGNHLLALVDAMLDIGRQQGGPARLQGQAVELEPLLQEILAAHEPLARQQGVSLLRYGDGGRHSVQADPLRVRQIVANLLSNALMYNRPGGHVQLRVRRDGDMLRIEVHDNGLGIAADQVPKLFRPFERLGRERSAIKGTGLGLALSEDLAREMDGRLEIDSCEGKGTVATLILPALAAPPASSTSSQPAAGCSEAPEVGPA